MAYDEGLATRVRDAIGGRSGLAEKQMFGGLAFLVHGNMACGVRGEDLIVRLATDAVESVKGEAGVRPFDLTGRCRAGCWSPPTAIPRTTTCAAGSTAASPTPPPCPQGAVTPLGDPFDPVPVAAEIDREIRALPAQGVQPGIRVAR